ncbi:MAG: PEP-CTERM sorting domain-containing protein [Gammaproteobacteria bacterium]|nr:PEP-CTERM sorting domain-containing protein [Gammaproteobacteria bacterium]
MCKLLFRTYVIFLSLTTSLIVNAKIIDDSNIYDVYGDEAWLYGYDNSTINIYEGSNVSWLYGYDNTNINISGGDISWLTLYDQSVTNITGVEDLSWLLVNDRSEVNIFGTEFNYSNGNLSGVWGNGLSFSFWALNEKDLIQGNISSILPENIRLRPVSVPEPGTILLFLVGLAIVSYKERYKKINSMEIKNIYNFFVEKITYFVIKNPLSPGLIKISSVLHIYENIENTVQKAPILAALFLWITTHQYSIPSFRIDKNLIHPRARIALCSLRFF